MREQSDTGMIRRRAGFRVTVDCRTDRLSMRSGPRRGDCVLVEFFICIKLTTGYPV